MHFRVMRISLGRVFPIVSFQYEIHMYTDVMCFIHTCWGFVGPGTNVGGLTAMLCSIFVAHLFSSRGTLLSLNKQWSSHSSKTKFISSSSGHSLLGQGLHQTWRKHDTMLIFIGKRSPFISYILILCWPSVFDTLKNRWKLYSIVIY